MHLTRVGHHWTTLVRDASYPVGPDSNSNSNTQQEVDLTALSNSLRQAVRIVAFVALVLPLSMSAGAALAADCGGAVACHCGDRVVADYTLTADLGPCTWETSPTANELVGLRLEDGVTLDCAGFSILGPDDSEKEEFGIRVGSSSSEVVNATIRNCTVRDFWWGIYLRNTEDVTIEDSTAISNGYFSETENGTGYGIDISDSLRATVRNSEIRENGNEGLHLSNSTRTLVEGCTFADNGFEQVYVINADRNTFNGNDASGGRQSLEMRDSDDNVFANNVWRDSPLQWLEDHSDGNTFEYDRFEGELRIQSFSNDNVFTSCILWRPGDTCVELDAANNSFVKSHFNCSEDIATKEPVVVERSLGADRMVPKSDVTSILLGCSGDLDGDHDVDQDDEDAVLAALGSIPGDVPSYGNADLDHDRDVDAGDLTAVQLMREGGVGDCDFPNKRPIAKLRKVVLANNPTGQADTVRLDAFQSQDDRDAIVRYEFFAESLLTGEEELRVSLNGVAPGQAYVDHDWSPGKYLVYVTVIDDHGEISKPKRTVLSVK